MQVNTANRNDIRETQKKVRLTEAARGEVVKAICSSAQGREFLWHKLSEASIFTTTYNDNSSRMSFLEGIRAGGLSLLNDILRWCPDQFIQMMREANERRTADNALAEQRLDASDDDIADTGIDYAANAAFYREFGKPGGQTN